MRIQIVSDLHNEAQYWVPEKGIDHSQTVLVVAGDICTRHQAGNWLATVANEYRAVVAVLGNHDYWDSSAENVTVRIRERLLDHPNVHLLDRDSVVIGDTRFVGCTLWTHVPPDAQMSVQQTIKDYERIRVAHGQAPLTASLVNQWHARDKEFLEKTLEQSFDGATFVVTHHAPSSRSIDARYKEHAASVHLNFAYHTNLEEWARPLVFDAWTHGHTHHSFDYDFGSGRLICNPRGYWPNRLNPDFNPELVVDSTDLRVARRTEPQNSYESWWSNMPPP